MKRTISLLLTICLLFTALCTTVFAESITKNEPVTENDRVQSHTIENLGNGDIKITYNFTPYANGLNILFKAFADNGEGLSLFYTDTLKVTTQKIEVTISDPNYSNAVSYEFQLESPANYYVSMTKAELMGEITAQTGSVGATAQFEAAIIELGQIDGIIKINPNAADPSDRVKTLADSKLINESTVPLQFGANSVVIAVDSPKSMNIVNPNVRTDLEWQRANKLISETELGLVLTFDPLEFLQYDLGGNDISAYDINSAGGMLIGLVDSGNAMSIKYDNTKIGLSQTKASEVKLATTATADFY